jgi:ribosomal-protein-alanine N-acetyltransferase
MLELNFTPFPEIQTERLILRKFNLDDDESVFEIRSNREVMKYIPRPLALTIEDAIAHIQLTLKLLDTNEGINWAMQEKSSNKVVGSIGIFRVVKENYRGEVGYALNPRWHSKGLMHEALQAVIAYGFEKMKLHSIEAIIDPENIASAKLLEKNKFRKEAYFKENGFFEGKFFDSVVYSLVKGIDY